MKNDIRVERERLCSPLRDLRNLGPQMLSMIGRLTLSVEKGMLSLMSPVLSIYIPAKGKWEKTVSVALPELVAAEGAIAQLPEVSLTIEDGTLLIGGVEFEYEVEED